LIVSPIPIRHIARKEVSAGQESALLVQGVIVSLSQTITWAIPLDSIVIGERLTTALSGVCMPFRRSAS